MALRPEYALGHSELNPFLFAAAGKDEAGQDLTVLSIFARLDLDPWAEASRLANLPREVAAEVLTKLLSQADRQTSDAAGNAMRLVDFLPRHGAVPIPVLPTARVQKTRLSRRSVWLVCLAAAALWFLYLSAMKPDTALEHPTTIVTPQ